jgi:hypothetical protein
MTEWDASVMKRFCNWAKDLLRPDRLNCSVSFIKKASRRVREALEAIGLARELLLLRLEQDDDGDEYPSV